MRVKQAIASEGVRLAAEKHETALFAGELIGLETIYENMNAAEQNLLSDLRNNPGPIRLFFHIASQNINISGSLFDIIDSLAQDGGIDLRILHASPSSPLFSRDRLVSLGKRPERVLMRLKHVDDSFKELEALASSTLRRRTHEYPFIWRIYGLSDKLYFMPYFSDSDATETSPVLVFKKEKKSLYHTFCDWFDHAWARSAPKRIRLSDLVTPATPSGTALFLQWEGYHVFGIHRREIDAGNGEVRFYGLGGKRENPVETFEDCALREGREESAGAVGSLSSSAVTDYFRHDGAINSLIVTGEKVIPRLILEKREHSGRGSMAVDDDFYFLVAFDGELSERPKPSSEIGALIFMTDEQLSEFSRRRNVTLEDLLSIGAKIEERESHVVPRETILVPHGTATYLLRIIS